MQKRLQTNFCNVFSRDDATFSAHELVVAANDELPLAARLVHQSSRMYNGVVEATRYQVPLGFSLPEQNAAPFLGAVVSNRLQELRALIS